MSPKDVLLFSVAERRLDNRINGVMEQLSFLRERTQRRLRLMTILASVALVVSIVAVGVAVFAEALLAR